MMVKAALFYADNGLVDSTDPGWLRSAVGTMRGILDWVGLRTNIRKTVGMVCKPFREAGVWADKAYKWRMTG